MKKDLIRFLLLIICFYIFQGTCISAQNQPVKYSSTAIQAYNAGVAFHNQSKYELAEKKYNQALKLQPDFAEAKKNLAAIYQNLACEYYGTEAYDKSIYYAKKSLALKPNDKNTKNTLSIIYQNLANENYSTAEYDKSIHYAEESLSFKSDNIDSYHLMAQSYSAQNNYEKANDVYRKILSIEPNNQIAQQNLKYVNFKHSDKVLNESINNLTTGHVAPERLYGLIKVQPGIDYYYFEKMKTILDLIWSEPNGKILLSALLKQNISININNGYLNANVLREKQKKTLYLYFIIPIASFTTNSAVNINIPTSYIDNFNNSNLYATQRIYNLQVFIHEFGHAFIGIKNPKDINSIEEEMGVSMIGYNIANKIITGKYLDSAQTETYSINCLIGLLLDEHRDLPVYSDFNKSIQRYGITMPYPELYSNIPSMYKKLLSEGKVAPAATFKIEMLSP